MNIWADEWDATDDWSGGGAKSKHLVERGPEGERQLGEGEVVHFPLGPDGAHGLRNET
jgi:hypothetical protein